MNEFDKRIEGLIDQQTSDREFLVDPVDYHDQEQVDFELQLQNKIDASLGRNFPTEPVKESVHRQKMEALVSKSKLPERRKLAVRAMVLAASLLLLASLVFLQPKKHGSTEIAFKRKPLAVLFEDSVSRGFKPYYVCDDPVRFAAEFQKHQGVPLRLAEMPKHKKMVGISYMGGVARETTSMLGRVNDKPVLVFVDNLSNDDEQMQSQVGKTGEYYVHRATKDGLVYYEVSGFEDAQLIEYFEQVDPQ